MTDTEAFALLKPHLERAYARGRAAGLSEGQAAAEAVTRTFAADNCDEPDRKPLAFYSASGFGPDDAPRFADYFAADDAGALPGDLHRHFGLTSRAFADAAQLLRKQVRFSDGRSGWQWVKRPVANAAGNLLAADDADEVYPEDFQSFADRADGEIWETNGRHYKREAGKTRRLRNPNAEERDAAKKARGDAYREANEGRNPKEQLVAKKQAAEPRREEARAAVQAAIERPQTIGAKEAPGFADLVHSLPRDEIRELARAARAKLGGLKSELVANYMRALGIPSDEERRATLEQRIQEQGLSGAEADNMRRAAGVPLKEEAATPPVPADEEPLKADNRPLSELHGLSPEPVGAKVRNLTGDLKYLTDAEKAEAEKKYQQAFGGMSDDQIAALVGAPDGADVRVMWDKFGRKFDVSARAPGFASDRHVKVGRDGKPRVENFQVVIDPDSPQKGQGAKLFARQVDALVKAGQTEIKTNAKGSAKDKKYVGYKVWPKLGYDGQIPNKFLRKMPADLRDALGASPQLSELLKTDAGRQWWDTNGGDVDLSFDLREGSASQRTLSNYLASKQNGIEPKATAPKVEENPPQVEPAANEPAEPSKARTAPPAVFDGSVRVDNFDPKVPERLPKVLTETLGEGATPAHVADALGAGPGAAVRISQARELENGDRVISATIKTPDGVSASRTLNFDPNTGRRWVHNDTISADVKGTGAGTALFARQAANAAALGVDEITAGADRGTKNGYYSLARWGFDAPLSNKTQGKLPAGLAGAKTVQDLMASPEGREWWKKNGEAFDGVFDTAADSRSQQTLAAYLEERKGRGSQAQQPKAPEPAVQPAAPPAPKPAPAVSAGATSADSVTDLYNRAASLTDDEYASIDQQVAKLKVPELAKVADSMRLVGAKARTKAFIAQAIKDRYNSALRSQLASPTQAQRDTWAARNAAQSLADLKKNPLGDKVELKSLAAAAPSQEARDYLETAAHNVPGDKSTFSPEDRRHQTVERLAAAHRDALRDGKPDAAAHVAQVLPQFGGKVVGAAGDQVAFDPARYEAPAGTSPDAPMRVVRPAVVGPDGRLAGKGELEAVGAGTPAQRAPGASDKRPTAEEMEAASRPARAAAQPAKAAGSPPPAKAAATSSSLPGLKSLNNDPTVTTKQLVSQTEAAIAGMSDKQVGAALREFGVPGSLKGPAARAMLRSTVLAVRIAHERANDAGNFDPDWTLPQTVAEIRAGETTAPVAAEKLAKTLTRWGAQNSLIDLAKKSNVDGVGDLEQMFQTGKPDPRSKQGKALWQKVASSAAQSALNEEMSKGST